MSSTRGRTHIILSIVMVLIGTLAILDGLKKGEPGLNFEIAIGIICIVYGITRYWFFRPRSQ